MGYDSIRPGLASRPAFIWQGRTGPKSAHPKVTALRSAGRLIHLAAINYAVSASNVGDCDASQAARPKSSGNAAAGWVHGPAGPTKNKGFVSHYAAAGLAADYRPHMLHTYIACKRPPAAGQGRGQGGGQERFTHLQLLVRPNNVKAPLPERNKVGLQSWS